MLHPLLLLLLLLLLLPDLQPLVFVVFLWFSRKGMILIVFYDFES